MRFERWHHGQGKYTDLTFASLRRRMRSERDNSDSRKPGLASGLSHFEHRRKIPSNAIPLQRHRDGLYLLGGLCPNCGIRVGAVPAWQLSRCPVVRLCRSDPAHGSIRHWILGANVRQSSGHYHSSPPRLTSRIGQYRLPSALGAQEPHYFVSSSRMLCPSGSWSTAQWLSWRTMRSGPIFRIATCKSSTSKNSTALSREG